MLPADDALGPVFDGRIPEPSVRTVNEVPTEEENMVTNHRAERTGATRRRPVARAAVVLAAAAALTGLTVPAAFAAEAPPDGSAVPATRAPSCIVPTQHNHSLPPPGHTNVYLRSTCSKNYRVKVIMSFGTDSACKTKPAHSDTQFFFKSTWFTPRAADVDSVVLC